MLGCDGLLASCSFYVLAVSPPADQEVEDAGTPSWRLFSQAKGIRVRRPAVRLSVMGSAPLTSPEQPRHDGVLHLQRALHRLHPGGQLAATATHAGRFSISTSNNNIKKDPVKRNTIVGVNEALFSFYSYWRVHHMRERWEQQQLDSACSIPRP